MAKKKTHKDHAPEIDDDELLPGARIEASDKDMDRAIDRANALTQNRHALTQNRHNFASTSQGVTQALMTEVGEAMDIRKVIDAIARELGLDFQNTPPFEAVHGIYQELRRLKNPSADVSTEADSPELSKGDSLAQAVAHNAAQRSHLDTELTKTRTLIARVAAAMQIGTWDADGTELLEKIQRWETLKHVMSRRIRQLREDAGQLAVAHEMETLLARLMAPKEFAKWLEGKPPGTVTAAVAELAAQPPGDPSQDMGPGDVVRLSRLIRQSPNVNDDLIAYLDKVFGGLAQSITATNEFLHLMNLVILPILARQAGRTCAQTGTPDKSISG
jgi:hypothetical protein